MYQGCACISHLRADFWPRVGFPRQADRPHVAFLQKVQWTGEAQEREVVVHGDGLELEEEHMYSKSRL